MSLGRPIGSVEYMRKRIPKNAKYQYVKTRLDTGSSLTKYMEKLEEIKKNYRYKKDEIFRRMKVTTFAQLVLQVASVSDLNGYGNDGDLHGQEDGLSMGSEADLDCLSEPGSCQASPVADRQDAGDREVCSTGRSTLLSVISGVGELNLDSHKMMGGFVCDPESVHRPYPDCPYLLLDVRDREQYERCHIISAHSFPIALLSRTMNPYTKEVLQYKNTQGKIIIVYDEDERTAIQAATVMCQRGVDNLFLLSGGLKVVVQYFPEGLLTGSIPPCCLPTKRSCLSQPPPQPACSKMRFSSEEQDKIREQLDESLVPSTSSSRLSSRMSSSSSQSKVSSAGSSRQSAVCPTGRAQSSRPWK